MSTIIAGRFQQQSEVESAIEELRRAAFPQDRIASFYVNPPGQHDMHALGGDVDRSAGAENTHRGAAGGAAAGAAAGMVAAPAVGPVGPLVGAYVGSLVGGLSQMKENGEDVNNPNYEHTPKEHRAGLLVAVAVDDAESERRAIETLNALGATDTEIAEGTIEDSDWVDFDPLLPPRLINGNGSSPASRA